MTTTIERNNEVEEEVENLDILQQPVRKTGTVTDLVERFKKSIQQQLINSYPPTYHPRDHDKISLTPMRRPPLRAQYHAIKATVTSMQQYRGTNVVAEMGSGKTLIAIAAAATAGCKNIVVLCPPHMVRKWKQEIHDTIDASATIVYTTKELARAKQQAETNMLFKPDKPNFIIMGNRAAADSYSTNPVLLTKVNQRVLSHHNTTAARRKAQYYICPDCFTQITNDDGDPLTAYHIAKKKLNCKKCQGPLWSADNTKNKKISLAEYVKRYMKNFFDLLIVDESHEYKGRGTARGIAAATLAYKARKTISLTGTFMGGYSSNIFYMLQRFSPEAVRQFFKYNEQSDWVKAYGFQETVKKKGQDDVVEDGRQSKRRSYSKPPKELPGISPSAIFYILHNTVFLRLGEVAEALPKYEEQIVLCELDDTPDPDDPERSQAYNYEELETTYKQLMRAARYTPHQGGVISNYLQSTLTYPDSVTREEKVYDPFSGNNLLTLQPLSTKTAYPKERKLLELIKEEKAKNRKVLVYVTHTQNRDAIPRLEQLLQRENISHTVLRTGTPSAADRDNWIKNKAKNGAEVLICNPQLVGTGLDLIDFPTIIWYELSYSTYLTRQASRRSWRIGQTKPVRVIFMAYQETMQVAALALIGKKLQSSLTIEGQIPEDELANYASNEQDSLITALTKQIIDGENESTDLDSLESIFKQARQMEDDEQTVMDQSQDWTLNDWEQIAPDNDALPALQVIPTIPTTLADRDTANGSRINDVTTQSWELAFGVDLTQGPKVARKRKTRT